MAIVKYIGVGNTSNGKRVEEDFNLKNVINCFRDNSGGSIATERKISDKIAKEIGIPARGIYMPLDMLNTSSRELSTSGNYWVPELTDGGNFFNALTHYSTVLQAGARMSIYKNGGNLKIVGLDTPAITQWTSENGSPAPVADPSFKSISMSPKILVCTLKLGAQLMIQSPINFIELISKELIRAIGLEIDRVALNGLGASNEPLGILNDSNVVADTFDTMSYANLCDMVSAIDDADANINGLSLITSCGVKKYMLKNFRNPSSGDHPIWNGIEDMKFLASNNMPNKTGDAQNVHSAIVGDFSNLVIGVWNGIDILVDKYKYSDSGAVRITALVLADVGILHPESFRKNISIVVE
jgi:HK97 family phage major capsid protein